MNFKRYVEASDTWVDSHYIMGTSTDTVTTLPADIYANDTTATVGLKGDMSQIGTPTPSSPIQPSECGERTNNWFDWNWLVNGYHISQQTGLPDANPRRTGITQSIDVSTVIRLYLSYTRVENENVKAMYSVLTNDDTLVRRVTNIGSGELLDVSGGTKLYIAFYDSLSSTTTVTKDNVSGVMLNSGSEALPYKPYGYKIPISSANTTTPVYLGEVQTMRKIKKFVLTGQETIYYNSTNSTFYFVLNNGYYSGSVRTIPLYCSHYIHIDDGRSFSNLPNNSIYIASFGSDTGGYIYSTDYTDLADFKTYLQQQYAAGTPVTVWYVLSSATTGIVNEPLRKIGDYADEVSGITIPTITGTNTISVDTTLQPSEVTVNYKGWHPVQSVHERENGAWT